ncbi:hypothetical protein [Streptomyces sp. NPDC001056]
MTSRLNPSACSIVAQCPQRSPLPLQGRAALAEAEAAEAAEAAEIDRIIERVRRDGRAHMNHMVADSSAGYGPRLAQAVPLGESIPAGLLS